MYDDVNWMPLFDQKGDCIGQLKFTASTRFDSTEGVENLSVQEVPSGGGECRGGVGKSRLLHHSADSQDIWICHVWHFLNFEDTVGAHLALWNVDGAQHASATLSADTSHRFQDAARLHEVIRQKNRDCILIWLQCSFRAADSVAEAEGLFLGHRLNREQIGCATYLFEKLQLTLRVEMFLQVEVVDEMRYDPVLSGRGHD